MSARLLRWTPVILAKLEDDFDEGDWDDRGEFLYDTYDLDDPHCPSCGSGNWSYVKLGPDSVISYCSECPQEKEKH